MTDPTRKLLADRALRDAARGLVKGDVEFIRESVAVRSVPARLVDRVSGGARGIADEAVAVVEGNRVVVATGITLGTLALAAWVFRERLHAGLESIVNRRNDRHKFGGTGAWLDSFRQHLTTNTLRR